MSLEFFNENNGSKLDDLIWELLSFLINSHVQKSSSLKIIDVDSLDLVRFS